MSFFSGLFPQAATPTPAPAPTTQVATPTPNPQVDPAAVVPTTPVSPLDEFTSLWEAPPVDPNAAALQGSLFANIDPAKMLAAARKTNYAASIPPEVMAKITAGGPDAAAALQAALNEVGQRAYANSSTLTAKMIDAAIQRNNENSNSQLPSLIKQHAVSDTIRQNNPALQHPAAKPILEALQSQFSVKYPNATTAEIGDMASRYLTNFGDLLKPVKAARVNPAEDWENYL